MRLRNTEHLELSTKIDSKCTHKKDSLHVFWMLRVIYKKNRTEPAVFFRTETETEPNPRFLSKPNRTELEKSIPHIPSMKHIIPLTVLLLLPLAFICLIGLFFQMLLQVWNFGWVPIGLPKMNVGECWCKIFYWLDLISSNQCFRNIEGIRINYTYRAQLMIVLNVITSTA